MKKAANKIKQELTEARQQLSNKQKECSKLEVEVQDLKKECEDEGRKCSKYNQEVGLTDMNKEMLSSYALFTRTYINVRESLIDSFTQPETPQTKMQVVYCTGLMEVCHLVASSLLDSTSWIKSVKIAFDAT